MIIKKDGLISFGSDVINFKIEPGYLRIISEILTNENYSTLRREKTGDSFRDVRHRAVPNDGKLNLVVIDARGEDKGNITFHYTSPCGKEQSVGLIQKIKDSLLEGGLKLVA